VGEERGERREERGAGATVGSACVYLPP